MSSLFCWLWYSFRFEKSFKCVFAFDGVCSEGTLCAAQGVRIQLQTDLFLSLTQSTSSPLFTPALLHWSKVLFLSLKLFNLIMFLRTIDAVLGLCHVFAMQVLVLSFTLTFYWVTVSYSRGVKFLLPSTCGSLVITPLYSWVVTPAVLLMCYCKPAMLYEGCVQDCARLVSSHYGRVSLAVIFYSVNLLILCTSASLRVSPSTRIT